MTIVSSSQSATSSPSDSSHGQILLASVMMAKFESAESIIRNWEQIDQSLNKPFYLFDGSRSEVYQYFRSVADLHSSMHFFVAQNPASDKLIRAHKLMQLAMNRLEKEFLNILSSNRSCLDSPRSSVSGQDSDDDMETESERVVSDLKAIADTMLSYGYGKECVRIYKTIRKSIVDESLYYLGVEKTTLSMVHKMEWEVVEIKIRVWLRAIKIAVLKLFYGEKILCEKVFSASPVTTELCFSEITREVATSLLTFPHHMAKHKKLSPEKMFRVLDLYDAVSDLWPEIESIFSYDSLSTVGSQTATSLVALRDVARNLLTDFESAINKETSKSPIPNGGVHPLTRYVMNYLIFLSDYSGILTDILSDCPTNKNSLMPESYFSSPVPGDHPSSCVSERLAWLVLVLLCKLDVKARLYDDVALSYLFLANNLNYIVSKVCASNLKILLGDHWLVNHERKVKQYASSYERIGWRRVMSSLPNPTDDISLDKVVTCFENFNAAFDEACKRQSSWVVPDQKQRDEIKASVANKVVSAYQNFYEMYRMVVPAETGAQSIVKYAPDDLGNYLSDLFY